MKIHSCIAGVVGVGVGVVGYEGVLLAVLGGAGFWGWASFCYQIFVAWVLFFQLLDFAVGLTKVVSEHMNWSEEIPIENEEKHKFEDGRMLHVERLKVQNEVMEIFVILTVWKALLRAVLFLVISYQAELGCMKTLHWNFLLA